MSDTAAPMVTPIPSLDAETIGDMTVTLYPGDKTPDSVHVILVTSGWREYYFIENVWFQGNGENPVWMNGILVNTRIHGSSYEAQVEFIPLKELQLEMLEGEIILQISRHLGSQFAEFKLHANLESPVRTIFNAK